MNLENLNLVELNAQETQEIEGGLLDVVMAIITITGAGYYAGERIGRALYYATH